MNNPDTTINVLRVNELQITDICSIWPANGTSGEDDRLAIKFHKGSAEIEIEPADTFDDKSRIVSQIQLMGRNRGGWRKRASTTIFNDSAGGEAVYIESTLTSGAPLNETAMPMVFRMQHDTHGQPDIDIVFHPSDRSLELKSYELDGSVISKRKTIKEWMNSKKIDEL